MSEFKRGDQVLVGARVSSVVDGRAEFMLSGGSDEPQCAFPEDIHPHPGRPIADLIAENDALKRECELAAMDPSRMVQQRKDELKQLRAARAAREKPPFEPGVQVDVRATVVSIDGRTGTVIVDAGRGGGFPANVQRVRPVEAGHE